MYNTYISYIETPRPKQTCSCIQMFALCGNRTRDLLRGWLLFAPIRQIGRQICFYLFIIHSQILSSAETAMRHVRSRIHILVKNHNIYDVNHQSQ
jgi:hypothetical protein